MYRIVRTKSFAKSYRRLDRAGEFTKSVRDDLEHAIDTLAQGKALGSSYVDHDLQGTYKGYRECHIKGDLLLVYQRYKKDLLLVLVDIGSHSQLFG